MKFILHNIRIWFGKDIETRDLYFVNNKVNVITGDSGSGKTNILAIIDYCLLSSRNNIVEQIINENSDWYSITFTLNDHQYFLGRRKLNLGQENSDVCFFVDDNFPKYPSANIALNELKTKLDEILGVDNKYPFKKENGIYPFEISFRSFLLFNYLTERVISLDNVFWDFEYFERSLFGDYRSFIIDKAIGYEDTKRQDFQKKLDGLKNGKKEFDSKQQKSRTGNNKFEEHVENILGKAIENGLLNGELLFDIDQKISNLNNVVENYITVAKFEVFNGKLKQLQDEKRKLEIELRNIFRAEKEFQNYEKHLATLKDVLQPIEILQQQEDNIVRSYETEQLIQALSSSLEQIKNSDIRSVAQPFISPIDKDRLINRIKVISKEIESLNINNIILPNKSTFAFVVATELKYELEKIKAEKQKLLIPQDTYIDNYPAKCIELEDKIKKELEVKPALLNAINRSIQFFYNQLEFMENYTDCEVIFNIEEFILQLKKVGTAYPYGKIGSKSNDMFLHLCFFLGFQKHFIEMKNQNVLPFLFIDQPSIPYYSGSDNIGNNDKQKLLDAFKLFDNFITTINVELKTDFQIILIEHAPVSYWENSDFKNFHTVEEFTNGNKLIPERITKGK